MHSKASLILGILVAVCAGAAVILALDWPWKARLFPMAIGIPVFVMAAVEVVWGLVDPTARSEAMDFRLSGQPSDRTTVRRSLMAVAWMAGFFAAIILLGFPIAVPLLVVLYVRFLGRESWLLSGAFALAVWGCFYAVFDFFLHLPFPAGLLQEWLGLA